MFQILYADEFSPSNALFIFRWALFQRQGKMFSIHEQRSKERMERYYLSTLSINRQRIIFCLGGKVALLNFGYLFDLNFRVDDTRNTNLSYYWWRQTPSVVHAHSRSHLILHISDGI